MVRRMNGPVQNGPAAARRQSATPRLASAPCLLNRRNRRALVFATACGRLHARTGPLALGARYWSKSMQCGVVGLGRIGADILAAPEGGPPTGGLCAGTVRWSKHQRGRWSQHQRGRRAGDRPATVVA